jgi:hypothetical protein
VFHLSNLLHLLWRGLISLWLYEANNKLRDWKNVFTLHVPPMTSTHLWLRCSNFFNPSKKNSFGFAANREIGKAIDLSAPLRNYLHVGTANINSNAGQSQFRRHPMLSNGRINTFPQQRSHPRFSVNNTRFHGNSSANNGIEQLGKVFTTLSEQELLKLQQLWQQQHSKHNTQRWRHTQSESNKRATYFNQQPANHQAEVRSYILYTYAINIHIKD